MKNIQQKSAKFPFYFPLNVNGGCCSQLRALVKARKKKSKKCLKVLKSFHHTQCFSFNKLKLLARRNLNLNTEYCNKLCS